MNEYYNILLKIANSDEKFKLEDRLLLCISSRILFEKLFLSNNISDYKNLNKYLGAKTPELFLYSQTISLHLHAKEYSHKETKQELLYKIIKLLTFLDIKNEIDLNLMIIMKNLGKIIPINNEIKTYCGLIIKKKWPTKIFPHFTYILGQVKSGKNPYEQKCKKEIFGDHNLSKDTVYIFKLKAVFLKYQSSNINMRFDYIESYKIQYDGYEGTPIKLRTFLKNFYENNTLSLMDVLVSSYDDSKLKNDLLTLFQQFEDHEKYKAIMSFKYMHFSKLDRVYSKKHNSLQYEFWTKNSRGGNLTLFEKEAILFLFGKKLWKENKIFDNKLKYNLSYLCKYYEGWEKKFPDNNKFNEGYDESKVVEFSYNNTKYLTSLKYKSLFAQWKIFMKEVEYNVITGNAGTGKTSSIVKDIKNIIKSGFKYLYLAPTHKARYVFESLLQNYDWTTDIETMTVQKLHSYNVEDMIKYNDFIIDEISMIEDEQWSYIFEFMMDMKKRNPKFKCKFVGDLNQIQPIYSIGFHKYIFNDSKKCKTTLKKQQRWKIDSDLNRMINHFINKSSFNINANILITFDTIPSLYSKFKNYDDYQIITPVNFGIYGKKQISSFIMGLTSNSIFTKGSKIIINNKDIINKGLYNNKLLTITEYQETDNLYKFYFEDGLKSKFAISDWNSTGGWSTKDNFKNNGRVNLYFETTSLEDCPFELDKVITIHSAQGSTFKNVIFILPPGDWYTKEMIYTAISRCSDKLIIIMHSSHIGKVF